jgi:O-antigen/teichoic acid export membrane protein
MTSLSEVGLYNLGYQTGMVLSLIVSAINFAWAPIFYDTARNRKDARSLLSRMFTFYAVVVSVLAVGAILFSREAILIMAAKPFHEAYLVVPAVVVGYLFQGLYFMSVTPIFYMKKTYVLPFLTGVAALVNIGLNIWWIPRLGIMGAAYATLVAFALLFALTHIAAQRYYRIPYAYGKISRTGLLLAGVYVANYFLAFKGILVPIAMKIGILLAFLGGMFLFRIVSVQALARIKGLLSAD